LIWVINLKVNISLTGLTFVYLLFSAAMITSVINITNAVVNHDENYIANLDSPLGIYEMRNHRINPENESRQNEIESVELVDLPTLPAREENKTETAAKEQPGFRLSLVIVAFYICRRHFKTHIFKNID
jgi:hypothetical protein